ncbi:MAG: HNH endonuclease [Patescibacteria group bacterium]|nr:HNH endonuclease [Patescibacteria group bacterium]MDE2227282.1 HNH endonuclease [Patescibacteria group bacterium]
MSGINNHRYNPDRSQVIHRNGRGFLKSQVKRLLKSSCGWCGVKKNLQLDHIIPICAGGGSEDSNAQTLCVKCNNRKRDTIDMELMKSYRTRGTSDQIMLKTIPNQAGKKIAGRA